MSRGARPARSHSPAGAVVPVALAALWGAGVLLSSTRGIARIYAERRSHIPSAAIFEQRRLRLPLIRRLPSPSRSLQKNLPPPAGTLLKKSEKLGKYRCSVCAKDWRWCDSSHGGTLRHLAGEAHLKAWLALEGDGGVGGDATAAPAEDGITLQELRSSISEKWTSGTSGRSGRTARTSQDKTRIHKKMNKAVRRTAVAAIAGAAMASPGGYAPSPVPMSEYASRSHIASTSRRLITGGGAEMRRCANGAPLVHQWAGVRSVPGPGRANGRRAPVYGGRGYRTSARTDSTDPDAARGSQQPRDSARRSESILPSPGSRQRESLPLLAGGTVVF